MLSTRFGSFGVGDGVGDGEPGLTLTITTVRPPLTCRRGDGVGVGVGDDVSVDLDGGPHFTRKAADERRW